MKTYFSLIAALLFNFILYSQNTVMYYEYWFDNDRATIFNGPVSTTDPGFTFSQAVECSHLPEGLHSFHIRFKDNNGLWSNTQSSFFHKGAYAPIADKKIVACEYWTDNDYDEKTTVDLGTGSDTYTVPTPVDLPGLEDGLHSFHVRFKDNAGTWSTTVSSFFTKSTAGNITDHKIIEYEYWLDNLYEQKITGSVNPGIKTFPMPSPVDIGELPEGLHTINFRFKDNAGLWSTTISKFFSTLPVPVADNKIDAYRYWYNDDIGAAIIVNLDEPEKIHNVDFQTRTRNLPAGEHTIMLQFRDLNGVWSSPIASDFTQPETIGEFEFYSIKSGEWKDPSLWSDVEDGPPLMMTPEASDKVNIAGESVEVTTEAESGDITIEGTTSSETVLKVSSSLTVHGQVSLQRKTGVNQPTIQVEEGDLQCVEP